MTRLLITPERRARPGARMVLAIATVAVVVVLALQLAGVIDGWNHSLEHAISSALGEPLTKSLPRWLPWTATAILAVGLPALILAIDCVWQRWIVWIVTMGLLILWAPVLALACLRPQLSALWFVTLCSGLLALYCASGSKGGSR